MTDKKCGHCGYEGPCYGTPIVGGQGAVVSAPWCPRCGKNDKLSVKRIGGDGK